MRTRTLQIQSPVGSVTGKLTGEPGSVGVVLAHGAGVGQAHPWMVTMRGLLATWDLAVMTFNYRYTELERKRPDSAAVLLDVHEAAVGRLLTYCDRVVSPVSRWEPGWARISWQSEVSRPLRSCPTATPSFPWGRENHDPPPTWSRSAHRSSSSQEHETGSVLPT
jgi:hypothetical protein